MAYKADLAIFMKYLVIPYISPVSFSTEQQPAIKFGRLLVQKVKWRVATIFIDITKLFSGRVERSNCRFRWFREHSTTDITHRTT